MKRIILLFAVMLCLNACAEKTIEEGVASMKMTMSSDNEQAKAALEMIGEIMVKVYFKDQKSRTEQNHQMTGENITIVDNVSKRMLTLINNPNPMVGKRYSESNLELSGSDLEDSNVKPNGLTKTILGYDCIGYDAIVSQNGSEVKMTMFVTDKIIASTQNTAIISDEIKGFPMYLEAQANQEGVGIKIIMEVTEIKQEKVDDKMFDMTIPEGYTKV